MDCRVTATTKNFGSEQQASKSSGHPQREQRKMEDLKLQERKLEELLREIPPRASTRRQISLLTLNFSVKNVVKFW